MRWYEVFQQNLEAREDYLAYLTKQEQAAQRHMDEAPNWEGILEARGRKKLLGELRRMVMMVEREAAQQAAYTAEMKRDT